MTISTFIYSIRETTRAASNMSPDAQAEEFVDLLDQLFIDRDDTDEELLRMQSIYLNKSTSVQDRIKQILIDRIEDVKYTDTRPASRPGYEVGESFSYRRTGLEKFLKWIRTK